MQTVTNFNQLPGATTRGSMSAFGTDDTSASLSDYMDKKSESLQELIPPAVAIPILRLAQSPSDQQSYHYLLKQAADEYGAAKTNLSLQKYRNHPELLGSE